MVLPVMKDALGYPLIPGSSFKGALRSRGLGVVRLNLNHMDWVNPSSPDELLTYLQHLVNDELKDYRLDASQKQDIKDQWMTALLTELRRRSPQPITPVNNVS